MLEAMAVVPNGHNCTFGVLVELLHYWRVQHWDMQAYVRCAISNFAEGFSKNPKPITDFRDINPYRKLKKKVQQIVTPEQARQEQERKRQTGKTVVWNPYG